MTSILVGTVGSGRGQASEHLGEHADKLSDHFGAPVVPGSLNLVLRRPLGLDPCHCRLILDGRFFWGTSVGGIPALAYRWPKCPLHILEMVAPVALRTQLGLSEGDEVSIAVEGTRPLSPRQHLSWALLWRLRGHRFYQFDQGRAKRFPRLQVYASQESMHSSPEGLSLAPFF